MAIALTLTLALILLISANALFVAVEFGFLTVNRDDVRAAGSEGDRIATTLDGSLARTSTNLSGAQLGITVSSLLAGYLTGPSVGELITGALGARYERPCDTGPCGTPACGGGGCAFE